jgi:3-phosphoshikimate 1-carboxyvinyltransferase
MAALCNGYTVITGDYQIRRRPVIELVNALNELHAEVFFTRQNTESPPVIIKGCVTGGTAHFSGFNSQVVSSVLLASPLIQNSTCIRVKEPLEKPYIQMTIDWMKKYGVTLKNMSGDYTMFEVSGGVYHAIESKVPSDWSGVAFPLVAAVCTPSHLVISGLDFNDAQGDKIVVDHLLAMGAHIHKNVEEGTLTVHGGKPLKGGLTINLNDIPDSLPALCVASCFAEGDTTFTGLAHVRVKETDRVAVMQTELARLGARVSVTSESMTVHGGVPLKGARVESHNDHRVAMALTAASLFCDGVVQIKDAQCTSVSFPHFFELMNSVGASLTLVE